MLKSKGKIQNFLKRQLAKTLAIVMMATSFFSSGMAVSAAYGEANPKISYGDELVQELVNIAASGTKYVWGGFSETGVDCRRYVWLALRHVFGTEYGYWVDDNGNAILDGNGNRISVQLPPPNNYEISILGNGPSDRICIEGNGLKSYYRVDVVGTNTTLGNSVGIHDTLYNGTYFSSAMSNACQYPGTIIVHGGHVGVGIGEYHSADAVLADYPGLSGKSSGTAGLPKLRIQTGAYNLGNSYSTGTNQTYSSADSQYWFGKTVYLSASSEKNGLYANNTGSIGNYGRKEGAELVILRCENAKPKVDVTLIKKDSVSGNAVLGAEFGLYSDASCTNLIEKFKIDQGVGVKIENLARTKYYVKELSAPEGYVLSSRPTTIDLTDGISKTITLYNDPVNSTILVQKIDGMSKANLGKTKLAVYEYSQKANNGKGDYVYLVDLSYDSVVEGFVIKDSYTNSEGVTWNDGTLHYTQDNKGSIIIKEIAPQDGYTNVKSDDGLYVSNPIDITESVTLTGNTAIKNNARVALKIKKIDSETGAPIEGVKFRFLYQNETYYATTDKNGIALFDGLVETVSSHGLLFEEEAPGNYVIPEDYLLGQEIHFEKSTGNLADSGKGYKEFVTEIVIKNSKKEPENYVTSGTLKITKLDSTSFSPVPGAKYSINKLDWELGELVRAKDINGNEIPLQVTDKNGSFTVENIKLGVYYVKEEISPENYAVSSYILPVQLLRENAKLNPETNTYELNVSSLVGENRQKVSLSLQKLDELTNLPVEGTEFELYVGDPMYESKDGNAYEVIPKSGEGYVKQDTLIGRYVTDQNGEIVATEFGEGLTEEEKKNVVATYFDSTDTYDIVGEVLTNGNYYFKESKPSDGYVKNSNLYYINAQWVANPSEEDLELNDGGIVTAYANIYRPATVIASNKRQTVTINFQKKDAEFDNNLVNENYYGLSSNGYNSAVTHKLVATLEGAQYLLYNKVDIVDVETGIVIPKETMLGTYTTDAEGKFTIDTLKCDAYDGHKLPNGEYYLVEAKAPQGYAFNDSVVEINKEDTIWKLENSNSSSIIADGVEHHDEILKQDVVIKKLSGANNKPLANAKFKVYSVAMFKDKTGMEIPFIENSQEINGFKRVDNEKFLSAVAQYGVESYIDSEGNSEFTTDKNGLIQLGTLIYGDYVIVETAIPEHHEFADGVYIQVPWVEETVDGTENEVVYQHDVPNIPEKAYTQEIVDDAFTIIAKIDSESDSQILGAVLAIYDENNNIVKDTNGNDLRWTSDGMPHKISYLPDGKYYIKEEKVPVGYVKTDDIEFFINSDEEPVFELVIANDRIEGFFTVIKTDTKTNEPLSGVEFEVRSAETVIDPITNETIFTEGEVLDTITTGADGKVSSKMLPIGIYDVNGFVSEIKYDIVETKPLPGQYKLETVEDAVLGYVEGKEVIETTLPIGNTKPEVKVEKTGTPETFVGNYEDKELVTVVKKDDVISYKITVQNVSAVSAWNVVLKDAIPENTKLVEGTLDDKHHAIYDADTNCIYWTIDELNAGGVVELTFDVVVTNNNACEIVNIANYTMPDKIPTKPDDYLSPMDELDWKQTDAVIHQVVEFHKTSTVQGGTTIDDATSVSEGDTITYHLTFTAVDDVYDIVVTDLIDNGLSYVDGSAKINNVKDENATYNPTTRVLTFSSVDVKNATVQFDFEVTVDKIENLSRSDYANVASVEFSINENKDKATIDSEVVTHYCEKAYKVEKHGLPETYEGKAVDAKDVTVLQKDDVVQYSIIVTNYGESTIKDIVVTDVVPEGLVYITNETPEGVNVWESDNMLTWHIEKINPDEIVELKFDAAVEKQEAQLIINNAHYGEVDVDDDEIPVLPENSNVTNDVVHQVIEFHKMSEVVGGKDKDDATIVSVDDTITYILEVIAKSDITNAVIADPIPDGLEFVGNVSMKSNNETDWTEIEDFNIVSLLNNDNVLMLPEMDLSAGTHYFKFDVKVNRIPMGDEKFYINQALLEYDVYTNTEDEWPIRESLESETVSHMTSYKISGIKTGKVETYVGDYESRHHVTVVKNNEEITYTISIFNEGLSDIKNLVIKDVVPTFTEFVKAENDGVYDEDDNSVNWIIDVVKSGEAATVSFVVKCNVDNEAVEIRNKASYAVVEDPTKEIDEDEWFWTPEVIHQTVALHKTASIDYGVNEKDAKNVEIGSVFTYKLKFEALNPVYGLALEDVLPTGLTFVDGTGTYKLFGSEIVKINDLKVEKDNKLVLPVIDVVPAGGAEFTFDVKVNDVKEYDTEYFFINKANGIVRSNEESEDAIEVVSETVSHKTMKSNKTETPKLGFDTIKPSTVWTIIAVLSAFAMVGFGYYGFLDNKKKRK